MRYTVWPTDWQFWLLKNDRIQALSSRDKTLGA
jgi:hypothetical protein